MSLVIAGAGLIGAELALHAARHGFDVILQDVDPDALQRAQRTIERLQRFRRFLEQSSQDEILAHPSDLIRYSIEPAFEAATEVLVEAVTEDPITKASVLAQAHLACPSEVIFATTTSAVPIGWLAERCGRPQNIIGTHFMAPVTMKHVVEVVIPPTTAARTREWTLAWLARLGKSAVVVGDGPGFVSNRILMLTINEAIGLLEAGVAEAATVDRIFTDCFMHRMGPLALADLIGLDTVLRTLCVLRDFAVDAKFEPRPLLRRLVESGALGQKTGRGIYDYASQH